MLEPRARYVVDFERTHSKLVIVKGAPHGLNVSHAQAFNEALLSFLRA